MHPCAVLLPKRAAYRRYVTRNFTFISSVLLCSNRLDVAGPSIDSGVDRRLCCRSLAACFLEGKPIAEFILALQVRLVLVTVQPLQLGPVGCISPLWAV